MRVVIEAQAFPIEKAHISDAGFDIRSPETVVVDAGKSVCINTGVHIQLPRGTVGFLKSKSGLMVHHSIVSEGVIDEGYTGSICVRLYNQGEKPYRVERGDKVTQLVIIPVCDQSVEFVYDLEQTDRGNNGFGSSGR